MIGSLRTLFSKIRGQEVILSILFLSLQFRNLFRTCSWQDGPVTEHVRKISYVFGDRTVLSPNMYRKFPYMFGETVFTKHVREFPYMFGDRILFLSLQFRIFRTWTVLSPNMYGKFFRTCLVTGRSCHQTCTKISVHGLVRTLLHQTCTRISVHVRWQETACHQTCTKISYMFGDRTVLSPNMYGNFGHVRWQDGPVTEHVRKFPYMFGDRTVLSTEHVRKFPYMFGKGRSCHQTCTKISVHVRWQDRPVTQNMYGNYSYKFGDRTVLSPTCYENFRTCSVTGTVLSPNMYGNFRTCSVTGRSCHQTCTRISVHVRCQDGPVTEHVRKFSYMFGDRTVLSPNMLRKFSYMFGDRTVLSPNMYGNFVHVW